MLENADQTTNLIRNRNALDSNCIQEITNIYKLLKNERLKYIKYKILYDAVQDCVSNKNTLDEELKTKVQEVMLNYSSAQVLPLDDYNSLNLLGISPNYRNTELSYQESEKLKQSIVTVLEEKYHKICEEFSQITNHKIDKVITLLGNDAADYTLNSEDNAVLELQKELEVQQKQYLDNLLEEQQILDDLAKLRLEYLPKMCNEKVKECEIKLNMNSLQTRTVQEKTRVDIFAETNKTFKGYEQLMKDVNEQREECRSDIEYLKKLKEKYKQVSCKEFSDLLKSYVEYKLCIERKRSMYELLES